MNIQVQEINGKLICVKLNHNEPINRVIMDNSLPMQDRLLCGKCFQQNEFVIKTIGIEQARAIINDKLSQQMKKMEEVRQKEQAILKQFQQKMKELQTQTLSFLDESIKITESWIQESTNQNNQLSHLIKGLEILSEQNQENDQISQTNSDYFQKLLLLFQTQTINLQDCQNILKKMPFDYEEDQKLRQTLLINRVRQNDNCCAIAFNNNGSIMVTGCGDSIKIYKFDKGQMTELKRLNNTAPVSSIVFSQQINWFAAGFFDNKIRCWKEQPNGEWISSNPGESHQSQVNCLILHNDQLISCSDDISIKVWRIDIKNNQIMYDYSLEKKHPLKIFCISLNQSQTQLASCCLFSKIILWSKGNQNKWEYQNQVCPGSYGFRMCFINEFQIVRQQYGGICNIYEILNGQFMYRSDLSLQLNSESGDELGFQTIYNKGRQLIVQRHNKYVYLMKCMDSKLKVVSDPIDCNNLRNYGALTNDGQYLVIFNQEEFRVYQLNYK